MKRATGRIAVLLMLSVLSCGARAALILHLEFEGNTADSSGFANHAARDPLSVGTITTSAPGAFGSAMSIQGLAWLAVPDSSSLSPTGAITMSAWVNPSGQIGSNAGVFFKGALIGRQPDWQLTINDRGTGGTLGPSGASTSINGTGFATSEAFVIDYTLLNPVPAGQWTHLASTYDGTVLRLYVNGALAGEDFHTDVLDTTHSPLYIGNRFAPSGDTGGFQGLMDELRIYDTALDAAQIARLANPTQTDVPEPVTLALAALGFAGIRLARRRRSVLNRR